MPANTPRGYTYPLYSDVQNFPAQIQDLAQDIDVDVQGLYDAVNEAYNAPSANVTAVLINVPSVTDTTVPFLNEIYDNDNMVDLAVNNTRISLQDTGIYLLQGWARLNSNGNATPAGAQLRFGSTGALLPIPAGVSKDVSQTETTTLSVTTLYLCQTPPEHITLVIRHNSPAAIVADSCEMSATKVSA